MIWAEFAEIIQRRVYGGDVPDDASLDVRDIYAAVRQYLPTIVAQYIQGDRESRKSEPTGELMYGFELPVQKHSSRNQWYLELPSKPIMFNGNPIPILTYKGSDEIMFTYLEGPGQAGIFSGLEAKDLTEQVDYWLEGEKIWIDRDINCDAPECLLVRYIPSKWTNIEFDENDPMPVNAAVIGVLTDAVFGAVTGQRQNPEPDKVDNEG